MKKRLVTLLATATMTIASVSAPYITLADEIDNKIETANQQIEELKLKLDSTEEELDKITKDIEASEEESTKLEKEIAETERELSQLKSDISTLEVIIQKREQKLKEQARSEQTENSLTNYIGVVLSSESLVDAIERIGAISDIVQSGNEMRNQQIKDKKAVEDKKSEVEKKLQEQGDNAGELSKLQDDLRLKKLDREVYRVALAEKKATAEEDKEKFEAEKVEAIRKAEEARKERQEREAAIKAAQEETKKLTAEAAIAQAQAKAAATPATAQKQETKTITVATSKAAETVAPQVEAPAAATAGSKQQAIANAALSQIGVIQDCTMLATNSLRAVGIYYHGWPAGYLSLGTVVSASEAVPGDLVYYANGGMGLAHIAVYIGNGKAVHGGWNGNQTVVNTVYVGSGPVFIRIP